MTAQPLSQHNRKDASPHCIQAFQTKRIGGWSEIEYYSKLDESQRSAIEELQRGDPGPKVKEPGRLPASLREQQTALQEEIVADFHQLVSSRASPLQEAITREFGVTRGTSSERGENLLARHADEILGASTMAIRLVLEEALQNHLRHGNRCDPRKTVEVSWGVTQDGSFRIRSTDQGGGMDLSKIPDPTSEEHLELEGGRGVFLIRSFAHESRVLDEGRTWEIEFLVTQFAAPFIEAAAKRTH